MCGGPAIIIRALLGDVYSYIIWKVAAWKRQVRIRSSRRMFGSVPNISIRYRPSERDTAEILTEEIELSFE
jgi:hypothetical protein